MTFNDVMPIFRSHERVFPEQVRNLTSGSRSSFALDTASVSRGKKQEDFSGCKGFQERS